MARHIFDFRFEHQTGSELFFMDWKLKISEPEARSKKNRILTVFLMRFFSTSGFDVRIFRVRKNGLLPGRGRKRKSKI